MELPNTYETNQGRALRQAVQQAVSSSGGGEPDLTEVFRILDHLVAEGPGMPRDFLLAGVLFGLAIEAGEQGRPELAEKYHTINARVCSREAVNVAMVGGLLGVGNREGWLPADRYDQVAALVLESGPDSPLRAMLASIERREV